MLGGWVWEQGPDVRTSPIIPCAEGMRGEAGHHHLWAAVHQHHQKHADDTRQARRHGIDQLTVSWRAMIRESAGGGCTQAARPSCALQATIAVWRWAAVGWSLGQVRSGLHKGLLPLQPQRDIGRGGHGPGDWGDQGLRAGEGSPQVAFWWGIVCLYHTV